MELLPDGVSGREVAKDEKFEGPSRAARFQEARSMLDLSADYAFFTPGLLFTHGGLDRDPVQEFMNSHPGSLDVFVVNFDIPIFAGMTGRNGDQTWNRTLLGVQRDEWDNLRLFLASTGIADRRRGSFFKAMSSEVEIIDPFVLRNVSVLPFPIPTVKVAYFELYGNRHRWKLGGGSVDRTGVPPRVLRSAPKQDAIDFAEQVFRQTEEQAP